MPAQAVVAADPQRRVWQRELRPQLPVVGVAHGREQRQRVDPAVQEDRDEHRRGRRSRGRRLGDAFLEQSGGGASLRRRRPARDLPSARRTSAGRARCRPAEACPARSGAARSRPRRPRAATSRSARTRCSSDRASGRLEVGGGGDQVPEGVLGQDGVLLLLPRRPAPCRVRPSRTDAASGGSGGSTSDCPRTRAPARRACRRRAALVSVFVSSTTGRSTRPAICQRARNVAVSSQRSSSQPETFGG